MERQAGVPMEYFIRTSLLNEELMGISLEWRCLLELAATPFILPLAACCEGRDGAGASMGYDAKEKQCREL